MHHQWLGLLLSTALFRASSIRGANGFVTPPSETIRPKRGVFDAIVQPRVAKHQQAPRILPQQWTASSLFLFHAESSPLQQKVRRRTGPSPLLQRSWWAVGATVTLSSSTTAEDDLRHCSTPRVENNDKDNNNNNNDTAYDHIVIGSGIGGLAVASLLAQSTDDSVLLLEQHTVLGGCTHTFARRGYSFGVGIHYVGEMGDPNHFPDASGLQLKKLLDALTPHNDPVKWDRMPNNFDMVLLGNQESLKRYDMIANQQAQALKQIFLSDEDRTSIDVYFDLIRKASKSIKRAFLLKKAPPRLMRFLLKRTGFLRRFWDNGYGTFATATVQEVLDSVTTNPELQAVLSYSWGDYGTPPNEAPFVMHALLTAHYANGAYYPQGGPQQISRKIERVLRARNCRVQLRTPVRRIIVEDGRAVGVELLHDRRILRANKSVVSNAGYHNTLHRLLPPQYRPHQSSSAETSADIAKALKNGRGGLSLFVGLRGDHDLDWKLPHQNLWIYPDDVPMAEGPKAYPDQWQDMQPHRFAPVFVGAPSGKDSQWKFKHPGRSTLEILTAAPWEWFQEYAPTVPREGDAGHEDPGGAPGSHGLAYDAVKEALAQVLWTRVRQGLLAVGASDQLPTNVQEADYYELGTPLTFAHYLWADRGAFYGLDHDTSRFEPEQFYLTLRSKVSGVEGLYLTGQDVASCGLAGAMCGGYLCASDILGVPNPYRMLQRVKKRRVRYNTTVKKSRRGIYEKLASFAKRRGLVRL